MQPRQVTYPSANQMKEVLNVFGKVDDILIVAYNTDGKDHGRMMRWVMHIHMHGDPNFW